MIARVSIGVRDVDPKQDLLRRRPSTAWLQMHKGCEDAGQLRVRAR